MKVVDTNVIAYLLIEGDHTRHAKNLLKQDSDWHAPLLWRSEFRNVLSLYSRLGDLALQDALRLMEEAEQLMTGKEYHINSSQILTLAASSECSAYDCEFIALARELDTKLITTDKKVLREFPDLTLSLKDHF
ncbi:MAG: type II toxin-antitoxin system VapC family toxin [Calditrichaeota bacterium]|nr:type II toxin-antitoxin system VapC family toxin [Calditrichota bacterium]MCB9089847.1 type II toxin-antitoxin system VapC family toxin [Calditrichia bacterium]